jgi:hypothetical protein
MKIDRILNKVYDHGVFAEKIGIASNEKPVGTLGTDQAKSAIRKLIQKNLSYC